MDDATLTAIAIIRGQQQGDTFDWDYEWEDDKGEWHTGQWQSVIDEWRKEGKEREEVDRYNPLTDG